MLDFTQYEEDAGIYLKHPSHVLYVVDMVVHVQVVPFWLHKTMDDELRQNCNALLMRGERLPTFKLELTYFALSSSLSIFSRASSWTALVSVNHGEISSLTSSGILESRLVCWFIITQVLLNPVHGIIGSQRNTEEERERAKEIEVLFVPCSTAEDLP